MKVIVLCLILAVAYADHHTTSGRGHAGTYHEAGHANAGGQRHDNIGGYPGTYHGGQGQNKPGVYHEAGHAAQGNRQNPTIGGYPGTHHVGHGQGGHQGGVGATHQGGYQTHGY